MGKPIYVGVFLDPASRKLLLDRVPPKHPTVYADHLTLAFGKNMADKEYPVGQKMELKVWGLAEDSKGQAVLCTFLDPLKLLDPKQAPHITISCADGVPPKYSNELVSRGKFIPEVLLQGTLDFYPRTTEAA
jgi:hypothetical protein